MSRKSIVLPLFLLCLLAPNFAQTDPGKYELDYRFDAAPSHPSVIPPRKWGDLIKNIPLNPRQDAPGNMHQIFNPDNPAFIKQIKTEIKSALELVKEHETLDGMKVPIQIKFEEPINHFGIQAATHPYIGPLLIPATNYKSSNMIGGTPPLDYLIIQLPKENLRRVFNDLKNNPEFRQLSPKNQAQLLAAYLIPQAAGYVELARLMHKAGMSNYMGAKPFEELLPVFELAALQKLIEKEMIKLDPKNFNMSQAALQDWNIHVGGGNISMPQSINLTHTGRRNRHFQNYPYLDRRSLKANRETLDAGAAESAKELRDRLKWTYERIQRFGGYQAVEKAYLNWRANPNTFAVPHSYRNKRQTYAQVVVYHYKILIDEINLRRRANAWDRASMFLENPDNFEGIAKIVDAEQAKLKAILKDKSVFSPLSRFNFHIQSQLAQAHADIKEKQYAKAAQVINDANQNAIDSNSKALQTSTDNRAAELAALMAQDLNHINPKVRDRALGGLLNLDAGAGDSLAGYFRSNLNNSKKPIRERVRTLVLINKLSKEKAVPKLTGILQSNQDSTLRAHAALLLGSRGSQAEDAIEPLIAALSDNGQDQCHQNESEFSVNRALRNQVGDRAAKSLAQIGPAAIDPLIEALSRQEGMGRARAARALGLCAKWENMKPVKALDALIESDSDAWRTQIDAIEALSHYRQHATPVLTKYINNTQLAPDTEVQKKLIWTLHEIAGWDAAPHIARAIKHDNVKIRFHAISALGRLPPDPRAAKIAPALVSALEDDDEVEIVNPEARKKSDEQYKDVPMYKAARETLINLGPSVIPAVLPALRSKNLDQVRSALDILTAMGPAAVNTLPHITPLTRHRNKKVAQRAQYALAAIKKKND